MTRIWGRSAKNEAAARRNLWGRIKEQQQAGRGVGALVEAGNGRGEVDWRSWAVSVPLEVCGWLWELRSLLGWLWWHWIILLLGVEQ